ncbi:glucosamine-6-phosphate deaminase [Lachnoanaerobaculum umeaense]|jgi:glucosamine-6-phosphate deaminase|uniref:Glucosamine-6-phosphate deaminase n=1 Tax=Lachnoanaerobaculum umeaense TaxID=617123 RepID=A0A385Q0S6_9FIRM|nr:glucosamine-6-phosphate deaminase [Lachnoanaerobaculum umeaense]AYA99756.1 glucosamine-6-phosphate deaminase [Lachnoanaerobaculum umeaense]PZW97757.1 glucosamine-6-phosphate deaminase [Lachnoanaerobaculum umeaense]
MRILCAKDYKEMSEMAADIIGAEILLKPDAVLGLATGSTPIGTYEELVRRYEAGRLDFSEIKTVNLDEYRGLTKENDQSYYYFMHSHLFDHVNIDKNNTNVPDGMEPDAVKAGQDYENIIKNYGGIDLQLLGLGNNGHIGFNEPCDEFIDETHVVDLTQSTIEANKRFFASIDDVPKQAYTMGIGSIMRAKRVLMVVNGKGKAEIVKEAFFGPITPKVPASILQLHNDFILIVDVEALSCL